MRSVASLLAVAAVAASAANLPVGTTTSTFVTFSVSSSSAPILSTTSVPPSFPTCAIYYGWNDTLSTATLITYTSTAPYGSTIYFDSTTSANSAPTSTALAKRENWSSLSYSTSSTISSSQAVTVTATIYPTTFSGPFPTGSTSIPALPPCSQVSVTQTSFDGSAPTSTLTGSNAAGTNNPKAQGQGQGKTGAGSMVSASVGAVSLFGVIGVALVL